MEEQTLNGWKPRFFLIWSGQAVSQLTSSVLQFAFVWYLTDLTKSAWVLSMAMLAGFLPRAVLGPFIGVFIDRYNRKRIMILSDLFIAGASLLLVVASRFGPLLPQWLIYLVLFLRAVGTAFHEPTIQAVTPQIVPEDQLVRCAGYSQSLQSISQIFSPALAALLYGIWSLNTIIYMDVIGALVAIATLSKVDIPQGEDQRLTSLSTIVIEAKEGWQLLKGKQGLLGLVFISTLYSLAMMPISALFPLMSISFFTGGTTKHAGFVEVVFAVGLLIGSLILGRTGGTKNKMDSIVASFFLMTVCLFATALLRRDQFVLFVVAAFFMGISGPFFWGMFRALLQQSFLPEYLGRVMALSSSITVIASPVGMIISGLFTEAAGAQQWFFVAGFMTLGAALLCLLVPSLRTCDLPLRKEKIPLELPL